MKAFLLSFLAALAILIAFYSPVLFLGREYYVSDHAFYFEPFARFIEAGLKQGAYPLWNPFCYCGMPQIANPSPGMFYFPHLLFALLPYSKTLAITMMVSQLVAFSAGYLISRSLGVSRIAAVCCAFALGFNGYMFSFAANYTLPATAAWGFLSLYCQSQIKPGRAIFLLPTVFCSHWMLMAGRPEIYVPVFLMHGLLLIRHFLRERHWRALVMPVLSLGLGILLSMMSLLPVYEWTKLSPRAGGLSLSQVFNWSCNWYDFILMVAPQPLGELHFAVGSFLNVVASRKGYFPFLPSDYLGPVVLGFACVGICDKSFKERFYLLAGFLIVIALALGQNFYLSPMLLKVLPLFAVLRYPVKLLIIADFFLAIFAARGIHNYVNCSKVVSLSLLIFWLLVVVVSGGGYLGAGYLGGLPVGAYKLAPEGFFILLFKSLFFIGLIGLLHGAMLHFRARIKVDPASLNLVFAAMLVGSLVTPAFLHPGRTVAPGFYRGSFMNDQLLALNKSPVPGNLPPRFLPLYFDPLKRPPGYVPRQPNNFGETYMQFCREMLLPNTNLDFNYPETFGYESAETRDYRDAFLAVLHASSVDKESDDLGLSRFASITSTKYLATEIIADKKSRRIPLLNPQYFKLIREAPEMNKRLYEVLHYVPRAYVSKSWTTGKQSDLIDWLNCKGSVSGDLIETATKLSYSPFGLTDEEKLNRLEGKLAEPGTTSGTGNGAVAFLVDNREKVSLSVKLANDGFVVLNDRFYPGWKVKIDSIPGTIYRANGFMRAVYLKAGSHLLEFTYEPESLLYGFYLALFAGLTTVSISLYLLRAKLWSIILYLSLGKCCQN